MSFQVNVDVTNPGQFFACCGLFELAGRLDHAAEAAFGEASFSVECAPSLENVLLCWLDTPLSRLDEADNTASPLQLAAPFGLLLDWWKDAATGGRELKLWAGTMQCHRIARAMTATLRSPEYHGPEILQRGQVVFDPDEPQKKVEPFYFDARRTPNSHSRDVGFSPNDLGLTTTAFPAVEVLCLIGLQRFRPAPTDERRVFDYQTWMRPIPLPLAPLVVAGAVPAAGTRLFRFETWYRTGQKKHKAFRQAVHIRQGD